MRDDSDRRLVVGLALLTAPVIAAPIIVGYANSIWEQVSRPIGFLVVNVLLLSPAAWFYWKHKYGPALGSALLVGVVGLATIYLGFVALGALFLSASSTMHLGREWRRRRHGA